MLLKLEIPEIAQLRQKTMTVTTKKSIVLQASAICWCVLNKYEEEVNDWWPTNKKIYSWWLIIYIGWASYHRESDRIEISFVDWKLAQETHDLVEKAMNLSTKLGDGY